MKLTKLTKHLKKGYDYAFSAIYRLCPSDPKAGFSDGEVRVLEDYTYQVKLNGDSDEAAEAITEKSADELRAYYENREKS